jgi:hypothetical protein
MEQSFLEVLQGHSTVQVIKYSRRIGWGLKISTVSSICSRVVIMCSAGAWCVWIATVLGKTLEQRSRIQRSLQAPDTVKNIERTVSDTVQGWLGSWGVGTVESGGMARGGAMQGAETSSSASDGAVTRVWNKGAAGVAAVTVCAWAKGWA